MTFIFFGTLPQPPLSGRNLSIMHFQDLVHSYFTPVNIQGANNVFFCIEIELCYLFFLNKNTKVDNVQLKLCRLPIVIGQQEQDGQAKYLAFYVHMKRSFKCHTSYVLIRSLALLVQNTRKFRILKVDNNIFGLVSILLVCAKSMTLVVRQ